VVTSGNGTTYTSNAAVGGVAWTTVAGATTFSVPSNHLGVCVFTSTDATTGDPADEPTAMTGAGQTTWTKHTSQLGGDDTQRSTLFYTLGEGGAAAAISVTLGDAQSGGTIICLTFSNVDTSGTNGSGALRQVTYDTEENGGALLTSANGGTYHLSMSMGARVSGSALVGLFAYQQSCTVVGTSGFTLSSEGSHASEASRTIFTSLIGTPEEIVADVLVSACSANTIDWIGFGLEVRPSTSGVDATNPSVEIRTPNLVGIDSVTVAAGYDLAGVAADNNAVSSVTYTCPQCSVTPAVGGTTAAWTITDITLGCSGGGTVNVITVTASDAAANSGTDVHLVTCTTPDTVSPLISISSPASSPATVGTGAQTITGVATDETAMHASQAVTWSCSTCSVTSGTATFNSGSGVYSFSVTPASSASPGTSNTVNITAKDSSNNVAQATQVLVAVSGDTTDPTSTIDCGSGDGVNCTYTNFTNKAVSGLASDASGIASITASSATCNLGPDSGLTSWSVPVTSCPSGANTITVTIVDGAGNDLVKTIQVTFSAALSVTSTACPPATEDVAYGGCTVLASGGSTPYTWDNNSGGTSLTAYETACTGLSISSAGVISGTPTELGDGRCDFTVKVTDNAAATATRDLAILVQSTAVEGSHDYFNTLKALSNVHAIAACSSTVASDNGACSLRNDAQVTALSVSSTGDTWAYVYPAENTFPNGDPVSSDNQDGALFYKATPNANGGGSGQQLAFDFGTSLTCGTSSILITWDWYWGVEFSQPQNYGGVTSYKTFQVMLPGGYGWWTLIDYFGTATNEGAPGQVSNTTDEFRAGMGTDDDNDSANPMLPTGMTEYRDGLVPSGQGTPVQYPNLGSQTALNVYHSRWTRYWIEIKPCQAPSAFTDWSAAYLGGATLNSNPNDSLGRWHMLSVWIADEDRTPQRKVFRAPMNWNAQLQQPGINRFRFEVNSSKTDFIGPFRAYARNLVVLKDYTSTAWTTSAPENDTTIFKRPVR
jgi:hypothetical protein